MEIQKLPLGKRSILTISRNLLFILACGAMLFAPPRVSAQEESEEKLVAVQEIQGRLRVDDQVYYLLPDLQAGDELYIYTEGVSGNLDPFIALLESEADPAEVTTDFYNDAVDLVSEGRDPLASLPTLAGRYFLVWNDDGGQGYDSAISYVIPNDGDYRMLLNSLIKKTFGDYRLLISINQPDVLSGQAETTDAVLAFYDVEASQSGKAAQEVTGTLDVENPVVEHRLRNIDAGDTLYVNVVPTSGNLRPVLVLQDFGGKPIRSSNISGQAASASLSYTFEDQARNHRLEVSAGCCEGDHLTSGKYIMLVGLNDPDVFSGEVELGGESIVILPTDVEIGIKLQQITGIDQKAESFGAVATLAMRWEDPNLAFRPDSCDCQYKTYTGDRFSDFVRDTQGLWPEFTIYNQQGNRWAQNKDVVSAEGGIATYFERFSITLQAPDFDFRHYPFDTQQLYIHVDQLFPDEYYEFKDWPSYTEIGDQLGEEEWFITDWDTEITTEQESTENDTSRFSLRLEVKRHLDYYYFRFFIPIFLILVVGWITFFLKDYGKRVDVTGANLLAFIAYNFTIAGDLPRLGYTTFIDAILVATFIVSVFILVYNVVLKRLEITGRSESAHRIDAKMIWAYPIFYFAATMVVIWYFFIRAV